MARRFCHIVGTVTQHWVSETLEMHVAATVPSLTEEEWRLVHALQGAKLIEIVYIVRRESRHTILPSLAFCYRRARQGASPMCVMSAWKAGLVCAAPSATPGHTMQ